VVFCCLPECLRYVCPAAKHIHFVGDHCMQLSRLALLHIPPSHVLRYLPLPTVTYRSHTLRGRIQGLVQKFAEFDDNKDGKLSLREASTGIINFLEEMGFFCQV